MNSNELEVDKMLRNSNLPDGCNRLDEPWSRDHINGYEEFGSTEPITKEDFEFFFEEEIKEQNEREMEFDNLVESHSSNNDGENMEMIIQNKSFSIGCETVGFSPIGALSGEEIKLFSIEDNQILKAIRAHRSAQLGEEVNWWNIYSTQQEVDAAMARTKRAHRTNIVKIEVNVPILRKATEDEIGNMETCLDCRYFKRDYKCHLYGYEIPDCAVDHTCGSCRCNW